MENETVGKAAHNPHNSPDDVQKGDSVHGSGRIQILFSELKAAGVTLFIEDGRLAFDGPGGAMTDELLARVRAERDGLLKLLAGPIVRAADPVAIPSGASCPFCRSELLEDAERGWRCGNCKRLAWVWTAGGGIVRADCERMALEWI